MKPFGGELVTWSLKRNCGDTECDTNKRPERASQRVA